MHFLWGVIKDFVKSIVQTRYKSDEIVQNDKHTPNCVEQLVDAVTMCIHIASPQHMAPPALCTPLPLDLETLKSVADKELTAAQPIGKGDMEWKD
ncbi:hypothetical protein CTRI78_v008464 [Colletotrichum trifolii]|uniref:Uncharacterized protein n=1 Tax=Colletotrichum trifolii TaxID=5466 RepID=A0A4R8R0W6_COLTR|nr:hypothetical protein CTRI78_v008464 [Colletotrichum trifolii]